MLNVMHDQCASWDDEISSVLCVILRFTRIMSSPFGWIKMPVCVSLFKKRYIYPWYAKNWMEASFRSLLTNTIALLLKSLAKCSWVFTYKLQSIRIAKNNCTNSYYWKYWQWLPSFDRTIHRTILLYEDRTLKLNPNLPPHDRIIIVD